MAPAFGRKFIVLLLIFIKGAPGSSAMVRKSTFGMTPGLKPVILSDGETPQTVSSPASSLADHQTQR
ncbi:hypothetical protein AAC387_Pa04g0852 [Persea americana]